VIAEQQRLLLPAAEALPYAPTAAALLGRSLAPVLGDAPRPPPGAFRRAVVASVGAARLFFGLGFGFWGFGRIISQLFFFYVHAANLFLLLLFSQTTHPFVRVAVVHVCTMVLSCDDGLVLRSPAEPGAAPKAIPAFWRVVRTAELIAEPGSKRKRLCARGPGFAVLLFYFISCVHISPFILCFRAHVSLGAKSNLA
jgi:hypothetical protein